VWPMSGERSSMVCSMISGSSLRARWRYHHTAWPMHGQIGLVVLSRLHGLEGMHAECANTQATRPLHPLETRAQI